MAEIKIAFREIAGNRTIERQAVAAAEKCSELPHFLNRKLNKTVLAAA
jgi:hypothetical protein